jgi:hypothetical protein
MKFPFSATSQCGAIQQRQQPNADKLVAAAGNQDMITTMVANDQGIEAASCGRYPVKRQSMAYPGWGFHVFRNALLHDLINLNSKEVTYE